MCGLIGHIRFDNHPLSTDRHLLDTALDSMSYRGPDDRAVWLHAEQPVALGHLRLSILDPSPEGQQPMHLDTCNGRLSMVFNGEVYNYLEIREELKKLGYSFHTGTDSEVILTAFAAWGKGCVERFNGMFAIAIYNDQSRELTLLRDRVGIKPLYYKITRQGIFFASEVKALKCLLNNEVFVDPCRLHSYMEHGYISGEQTAFKNIFRLPPGHRLIINSQGHLKERYWSIQRPHKQQQTELSYEQATKQGLELLESSLDFRLRADVPVGVFLSGGLDSSAVVAMLAKKLSHPVKTFSVRYDIDEYGEEFDESQYAEQVAKQFGTEHHTYTMTAEDFENYIPAFVRTMDEPVAEAAALSLHFISEIAKEHVTVVLSGEGSDELFAGYDLYQYMQTLETIRKFTTPAGAKLIATLTNGLLPQGNKIRKYANLAATPFEKRYRGISVYDTSYHDRLYTSDFKKLKEDDSWSERIMSSTRQSDLLSRMLEFDTRTWLVDDLLIKADRMSMGSSLELRVPFLDHRMVEFAAQLPPNYKIRNGQGKAVLKNMMKGLLPDNIIHREKRGFPTPLARMFKGPLRSYVEKRLLNKQAHIENYFQMQEVERLCNQHWSGQADHHRILWQLVILEEWLIQNNGGQ